MAQIHRIQRRRRFGIPEGLDRSCYYWDFYSNVDISDVVTFNVIEGVEEFLERIRSYPYALVFRRRVDEEGLCRGWEFVDCFRSRYIRVEGMYVDRAESREAYRIFAGYRVLGWSTQLLFIGVYSDSETTMSLVSYIRSVVEGYLRRYRVDYKFEDAYLTIGVGYPEDPYGVYFKKDGADLYCGSDRCVGFEGEQDYEYKNLFLSYDIIKRIVDLLNQNSDVGSAIPEKDEGIFEFSMYPIEDGYEYFIINGCMVRIVPGSITMDGLGYFKHYPGVLKLKGEDYKIRPGYINGILEELGLPAVDMLHMPELPRNLVSYCDDLRSRLAEKRAIEREEHRRELKALKNESQSLVLNDSRNAVFVREGVFPEVLGGIAEELYPIGEMHWNPSKRVLWYFSLARELEYREILLLDILRDGETVGYGIKIAGYFYDPDKDTLTLKRFSKDFYYVDDSVERLAEVMESLDGKNMGEFNYLNSIRDASLAYRACGLTRVRPTISVLKLCFEDGNAYIRVVDRNCSLYPRGRVDRRKLFERARKAIGLPVVKKLLKPLDVVYHPLILGRYDWKSIVGRESTVGGRRLPVTTDFSKVIESSKSNPSRAVVVTVDMSTELGCETCILVDGVIRALNGELV